MVVNIPVAPIPTHVGDPSRGTGAAAKRLDRALGPTGTAGKDLLSAMLVVIEDLEVLEDRQPFSGLERRLLYSPSNASRLLRPSLILGANEGPR